MAPVTDENDNLIEVCNEPKSFARGNFVYHHVLNPTRVPAKAGVIAIRDITSDMFVLNFTTNVAGKLRGLLGGNVGAVINALHPNGWEGKLEFYYALLPKTCVRPSTYRHEVESTFKHQLLTIGSMSRKDDSNSVYVFTYEPTGEYLLSVANTSDLGRTLARKIIYLNKFQRHKNPPAFSPVHQFVHKNGPFNRMNGLSIEEIGGPNLTREEGLAVAAKYARIHGTEKLLTGGIVPLEEWNHPILNNPMETSMDSRITNAANYMGILPDYFIAGYSATDLGNPVATPMISPYNRFLIRKEPTGEMGVDGKPVLRKIISYGQSSYGYDIRMSRNDLKVFTNVHAVEVDPRNINPAVYLQPIIRVAEDGAEYVLLPGKSGMLGHSLERFNMPPDVFGTCQSKSTYARALCGVIVTPLEPGWCGDLVIEVVNYSDIPVRVYLNQGIAQVNFYRGLRPDVTYADRDGKYQHQSGTQNAIV